MGRLEGRSTLAASYHRSGDRVWPGVTVSDGADATLVARVADGDEVAFEELFHRHGSAVESVARRVLRDPVLAEDVVQETFTGLWSAPDRFSPDQGSLRSFLTTVAHRRAIDVVRSEVARSRREQRPPPDPEIPSVEEEALTRTVSEVVRRAIDDLPPDEREPIALAYIQGMSYAEVARRLQLPEGTVKSRIRNGMRRLSNTLSEVL